MPPSGEDLPRPLLDERPVLVVERLVHLVEEEDRRIGLVGGSEAEPRPHALRVARRRAVERPSEAARGLYVRDRALRLAYRHAGEHPEQLRVLPAGERRHHTGADGEECADPALDLDRAGVRDVDARDRAQQRRLATAAAADESHRLAGLDVEVDPLEPPLARAGPAGSDACERRRDEALLPVEEKLDSEPLRDDPGAHPSTSFANCVCSRR